MATLFPGIATLALAAAHLMNMRHHEPRPHHHPAGLPVSTLWSRVVAGTGPETAPQAMPELQELRLAIAQTGAEISAECQTATVTPLALAHCTPLTHSAPYPLC